MSEPEIKIILTLISLGFFGGFSHCSFMCGPFVIMQVNNQLSKIEIDNYNNYKKIKILSLIPYHLGRVTTYSFLGLICGVIGKNINNYDNFRIFSASMLFFASFLIFKLILKNINITIFRKKNSFFSLIFEKFFKIPTKNLFLNPKGFNGYALGIILGFIPCGLLYSALIICLSLNSYLISTLAMLCFAISTIPALFVSAGGGYIMLKKTKLNLKLLTNFILLINMIMLFIMALSQLKLI
jgi:sulfite exporter TauE/SafE